MSCIQYLLVRVICKPLLYQLLDLNTFLQSNPNDCYLLSMQLIWLNPNISENVGSVSLPSLFTPQPNPYHTTLNFDDFFIPNKKLVKIANSVCPLGLIILHYS